MNIRRAREDVFLYRSDDSIWRAVRRVKARARCRLLTFEDVLHELGPIKDNSSAKDRNRNRATPRRSQNGVTINHKYILLLVHAVSNLFSPDKV